MVNPLPLPQRRFWFPAWIWVAIGLLVLVLVIVFAAPQSYPGGSSYGQALGDYSQWYAYMQRQGHSIQRWQRPYSQLKDLSHAQKQTLIQITDEASLQAEITLEMPTLQDWVKQGNTLIQLSWAGQITGAPFKSDLRAPQGLVRIETSRRHKLIASKYASESAELKDAFGSVIWSQDLGKGRIVRGTYPWVAANVYAAEDGNFRALEALATRQQGPIWVDEWLHGHRDLGAVSKAAEDRQSPWAYLSRQPIAVVAGEGVVLLLLLIWGKNQRFGSLRSMTVPTRNSSEQYIQALAETLEANGQTGYVLSMLGQSFRQRLQTHLGLSTLVSKDASADEMIAQQWSLVTGRPPQELLELLQQTQNGQRLNERALLNWVQNSEALLKDLAVSGQVILLT